MSYKKIKTYEDACKKLGIDPKKVPIVSGISKIHREAIAAHYKIVIIAQALNDGWQPNWNDFSEYKYYPWFNVKATAKNTAGSGLSCDDYVNARTSAGVGSRLCYKSSEIAEYAGKKFKALYTQYMLFI
jgi:hypothetical protein